MSIIYVTQSPGPSFQASSAYGGVTYSAVGINNVAYIPAGGGTVWAVYQHYNPSLPPGEAFNGVRLTGGHDFTVGGGGGSIVRVANCVYRIGTNWPADFLSQPMDGQVGYVYGTGVGASVNMIATKAGITTDHLRAGNFFVGLAVGTDANNSASGIGTYRNSILNWTIYTGGDSPTPPAGTPSAYLIQNAGNYNPGKYPGQQFASTGCEYDYSAGSAFLDFNWRIDNAAGNTSHPITFANSGTATWTDNKGTSRPLPPDGRWWHSESGLLNIGLLTPPGTYTLRCNVSHGNPGYPPINLSTPLIIPLTGGFWPSEG